MSAAKKTATHTPEDAPLTDAEQDALQALGWQPAGGGVRQGGKTYVRAQAPDGTRQERTRAEWRVIITASEFAPGVTALVVPSAASVDLVPVDGLPQLSPTMQRHVDRTLAADRKGGEALWEKACAVADARNDAKHGEWTPYLEATGQNERAAQRLTSIAERGRAEGRYRDAIISGFLSFSVAAITAQADEELLTNLLASPEPPSRRDVEVLTAKPTPVSVLPAPAERPSPPSIVTRTVEDADLARALGAANACGSIAVYNSSKQSTVKTLVEYDGLSWACVSSSTGWAEAIRVFPLTRWPYQSWHYVDKPSQGYTGVIIWHRKEPYVLTHEHLEVRAQKAASATAPEPAPVIADPDSEVDDLIADLEAVEARIAAGIVSDDDRKALDRISARADALGAFNAGAYADNLRRSLGATTPELPAGWRWRDDIPPNPADPRPLYQARRAGGLTARASHDQQEAAENAAWSERRNPLAPPDAPPAAHEPPPPLTALDLQPLMRRAAALGYNVLVRANNVELVARDKTRGETFDDEARLAARIEELEATAATARTPTPTSARVAPAPADDRATYTAAERALADELAAASPRLRRLLMIACSDGDCAQSDATDSLFDYLTDGLLAAESDMLAWALSTPAPTPSAGDWPGSDHPDLDDMTAELLGAEMSSDPPAAADVARWQDILDAFAEELSDETYQRLAHRIGVQRKRTQQEKAA